MDDLINEKDLIPGVPYAFYPCGNNKHFHMTSDGANKCQKVMMENDSFPKDQKPLTSATIRKVEFEIIKGGTND